MAITPQERELIIIGSAVACGCKALIRQDMLVANQLHVPDTDITAAIAVAIDIRRCATNDMEYFVSSGLVDSMGSEQSSARHRSPRKKALVSIGAAFAVNSVSSLTEQLANARAVDIDEKDIDAVVGLSSFIKAMAASHVERLMSVGESEDDSDTLAKYGTPFGPERCAWAQVCNSNAASYLNLVRLSRTGENDPSDYTGAL